MSRKFLDNKDKNTNVCVDDNVNIEYDDYDAEFYSGEDMYCEFNPSINHQYEHWMAQNFDMIKCVSGKHSFVDKDFPQLCSNVCGYTTNVKLLDTLGVPGFKEFVSENRIDTFFDSTPEYFEKVAWIYENSSYFKRIWSRTLRWDNAADHIARDIIRYIVAMCGNDREKVKQVYFCSPFARNEYCRVDKDDVDALINDAISYVETYGTIFVIRDSDLELVESLAENDYGNASLLLRCSSEEVKYIPSDNSWRVFNGKYWRILSDSAYNLNQRCQAMYERLYVSVRELPKSNPVRKRVVSIGNQRTVKNLIEQLKLMVEMQEDKFDAHANLLVANNGVINLCNGELIKAKQNQYLTSHISIDYNFDAPKPNRFVQFINEIFDGDCDLINYVQKLLGYCITGETKEQVLFWFNGSGSNGKSLLIKIINNIFGEICSTISSEALAKKGAQSEINTSLYQAKCARMVFSSENEDDMAFNLSLIKQITGEDTIKVRTLFKVPVEFKAKFKMLLVSNPRLNLGYEQVAMRRRIRVIPFKVSFNDKVSERTIIDGKVVMPKDVDLYNKLMAERESILKWVVDGAVKWYKEGLSEEPIEMKKAYEQLSKGAESQQIIMRDGAVVDKNTVASYIVNNLEITGVYEDVIQSTIVYDAYRLQCQNNDEKVYSQTAFGRLLGNVKGVSKVKEVDGKIYYHGLRFKSDG